MPSPNNDRVLEALLNANLSSETKAALFKKAIFTEIPSTGVSRHAKATQSLWEQIQKTPTVMIPQFATLIS